MQYRFIGKTGVEISSLTLGTMMFGGQTSEKDSIRIIHKAIDSGINSIDTANIYNAGESESVVGNAIAGKREHLVLATKARVMTGKGPNRSGGSRLHLMQELEKSLKRLQTDHVDLFYLHAPDENTKIDETLRVMDDMIRSGKTRYIACSNFRGWQIAESAGVSDRLNLNTFCVTQPRYNLVNRDAEVELFPCCRKLDVGVISYSPLARGILTGKYEVGKTFPEGSRAARGDKRMQESELRDESLHVAREITRYSKEKGCNSSQFSIAWVLANPNITSVILGPRTMEQFEDNLESLDCEISADDEKFVDSLVPPGEHTGKGFQDSAYPVTGRQASVKQADISIK
jgi:aryl-alcohol dehydrogenase-like predicted oxidoreductase